MDPELHLRLQRSEPEALQQLYRDYSATVYAICHRMLRDPQRAEEVMQDTFWQLWSKPQQFDPNRGRLSTFVIQVARSRCLDRLRAERSRSERIQSASAEIDPVALERDAPTPLQTAIDAEEQRRVRRALEHLETETREMVVLNFFDGLSHAEIADRTGAPLGSVKTRIRRGLTQLRRSLQGAIPA